MVSFTVETDGRLPDGSSLGDAIEAVDAATGGSAEAFMVNCAHPTHVAHAFDDAEPAAWRARIGGLRANASTRSHAELDESTELDAGDPEDLAVRCARLRAHLPAANTIGGCCGTDVRHIDALAARWLETGPS